MPSAMPPASSWLRVRVVPAVVMEYTSYSPAAAQEAGASLDGIEIVEAPHSHAAAERAIELVREGRAELLMKGKLHTDELMAPAIANAVAAATGRRYCEQPVQVDPAELAGGPAGAEPGPNGEAPCN